LDGGIPMEAWIGKKVNCSFLKTFDCEAFVHIDKENITKLEVKSNQCTFIGYNVYDFGYRLWDYENHKIIRIRDVVFNEILCTKFNCMEINRKRKTQNTWCLMKSNKMKFQRYQKIKMYNNRSSMHLKLLQVFLEYLPG
jgi:hypothetical protein